MLEIEFTELTDCGRVRDHNEDYHGHFEPLSPADTRLKGWLFVLADGVGGHEKGEVASRTAVESVLDGFALAGRSEGHAALLPKLVQSANTRVYEAGRSGGPGGVPMATTLVACALRYDRAAVAHVGDSRCYLVRGGHATALTKDHTVAGEQLRMGLLTTREASEVATKNVLSRSLGNDLFVRVDSTELQVFPGDVLVQCSDGLHKSLEPEDLASRLGRGVDLGVAARQLVELANRRDGSDNVSVQLVRVLAVERVGMYRGRPYRLP